MPVPAIASPAAEPRLLAAPALAHRDQDAHHRERRDRSGREHDEPRGGARSPPRRLARHALLSEFSLLLARDWPCSYLFCIASGPINRAGAARRVGYGPGRAAGRQQRPSDGRERRYRKGNRPRPQRARRAGDPQRQEHRGARGAARRARRRGRVLDADLADAAAVTGAPRAHRTARRPGRERAATRQRAGGQFTPEEIDRALDVNLRCPSSSPCAYAGMVERGRGTWCSSPPCRARSPAAARRSTRPPSSACGFAAGLREDLLGAAWG